MPWEAVKEGGPWAVLVMLAIAFLIARSRGILATEKDVERTVGGYKAVIDHQDKELAYWRAASDKKDLTIEKQAEQIAKLMKGVDLSTYAIESVLREAGHHDHVDP
jgi:hypothetical protein